MTASALVICSDCLAGLRDLPDDSVDSVVTDPPSGIAFMGAAWDKDKGGRDAWIEWLAEIMREVWRVTKPGGHALVWALPRTQHWTATAVEDAGWQVRDVLMHVFGSGFPKSMDVSKQVDRTGGVSPATSAAILRTRRECAGMTRHEVAVSVGCTESSVRDWEDGRARSKGFTVEYVTPSPAYRAALADLLGYTSDERRAVGVATDRRGDGSGYGLGHSGDLTAGGNTTLSKQWAGWGTALKPSHEAWILARKPLAGTVAATVLEHGTGALNIDGCRVGYESEKIDFDRVQDGNIYGGKGIYGEAKQHETTPLYKPGGRWPPHLLISHGPDCGETCVDGCPVAEMDAQSGVSMSGVAVRRNVGHSTKGLIDYAQGSKDESMCDDVGYGDTGGASRFFPVFRYVAKPSTAEKSAGLGHRAPATGGEATGRKDGSAGLDNPRAGAGRNGGALNIHPTVKPRGLMEWLVKLITPPGGVVLDPFTGSGSTGVAAVGLGFDFIGFEMSEDFAAIARDRIGHAVAGVEIETVGIEDYAPKPEASGQGKLF